MSRQDALNLARLELAARDRLDQLLGVVDGQHQRPSSGMVPLWYRRRAGRSGSRAAPSIKRTTGLEPATFGLGSQRSTN